MSKTMASCIIAAGALLIAPLGHAYEVTAVTGGGKISGRVALKGAVPEPKKFTITKDNNVCGTGTREFVEVAVKGGNLRGAVIYIDKIAKGKAWGDLEKPVLDQKGCTFTPDVMILRKEGDLTIRNSDAVLHNIHTYEIIGAVRRTMFNVGQPDKGDLKQPVKMRRSNTVKVECDAHDFMHAWAFTAENPYAVVSKEDGSFTLENVPAGEYELKVWHPLLGEKSTKVTVAGGGTASAAFEYTK